MNQWRTLRALLDPARRPRPGARSPPRSPPAPTGSRGCPGPGRPWQGNSDSPYANAEVSADSLIAKGLKKEKRGRGREERKRARIYLFFFFNCTLLAAGPRAALRDGPGHRHPGSPRPAEPGRTSVGGRGNSQGMDFNFSPGTHEAFCTAPEGREPTQIGGCGIEGAFPRFVPCDIII